MSECKTCEKVIDLLKGIMPMIKPGENVIYGPDDILKIGRGIAKLSQEIRVSHKIIVLETEIAKLSDKINQWKNDLSQE